jgi:uncharacterized protein involved in outer membrane biogenesis
LLMLVAVALAALLPRIVDTAAVRERLAHETSSALGHRLGFQQLGFQLIPPLLVMKDATLGAAGEPWARAERIELSIAWSPLLVGIALVDEAVVEGARLLLVRTAGGVQLDRSNAERLRSAPQMNWVLRRLELRSATIALDDRSVGPPVRWQLREIEATAVAEALDLPVRLKLAGEVATGGQIVASGSFSLAGDVDFELKFESVAIAAARPYFESDAEVSGALTGSIWARGSSANWKLEMDATIRDARLQLGDIALRGLLDVDATIDNAGSAPHGRVALDATSAELAYGEFFTKPPGTAASVVGLITTNSDGITAIERWQFVMEDLDGHVRAHFGDRVQFAIDAIPPRRTPLERGRRPGARVGISPRRRLELVSGC